MPQIYVAILNATPVYQQGLTTALSKEGYIVEHPDDLVAWSQLKGRRAILLSIHSDDDMRLIGDLKEKKQVRGLVMALLDDSKSRAFGEALLAGADTAAASSAKLEEIIGVLKAALESRASLPIRVAQALAEGRSIPPDTSIVSTREVEWLRSLATGATVATLAHEVGYSEREMYRCLADLYKRMGVRSRVEALVQAARWRLLD